MHADIAMRMPLRTRAYHSQVRLNRGNATKNVTSVRVEIDMPGEDDKLRSATASISNGRGTLRAVEAYDASSGSALRLAIDDALASAHTSDSEIMLVVYASEKKGQERELGIAKVS